MIKLSKLILLLVLSLLIGLTDCFAGEDGAVYVVDVQKIVTQSIIGKAAKNNIDAELKKSESKLLAQRQEIDRLKEEMSKQKSVLSKEALEQKGETFRKKQRDLELAMGEEQDKLRRKNGEEIEKVLVEVRAVLADLAEEKDYKVIVEKDPRLVVFVNPKYDLTDEVVKALDTKKLS